MTRLIFLPLAFLIASVVCAQTHPCGFNNYMDLRYEEDPSLIEMRQDYEEEIQSIINSRSFFEQKTIPVVIHIIYNDSYSNISNSQVYSAINALNEDFNANNSDFSSVVSSFNSVKSDLEITFELAGLDPDGNPTTGITRTQSDYTDNAGENVKSLILWDTDMYLNVWVVDNIESGAGAYAYYPGTAPGGAEGIVCRHNQFGTTGTSSSSNFAATTMTHEVGHYLNLAHTWGDSNDPDQESNCSTDDNVSDTPNTIGTLYGCNTSQSTCGSLDNVQNYMDYTDCTNMFTHGQRARVHAALHSAQGGRVNLWQYENLVATGVLEESECLEENLTVQIQTGSYAYEISWVILDSDGEGIAGGGGTYSNNSTYYTSVCIEPGTYTFQTFDTYGDGWNGGYYTVRDCDNSVIANDSNPSGYGETESFIVDACSEVLGCTDSNASNYNPEATDNDGSCIYQGCTDELADNFDPQANLDDGTCEYTVEIPEEFNYELTGSNHTIVIPSDLVFNLLEAPIQITDIIGVFYEDENGVEHCAGYIVWEGTTNSIAAQGDDSTTDEIDGFPEGAEFTFKVYDSSEGILFDCVVNYNPAMVNQELFTTNGISSITGGHIIPPVNEQVVNLPLGWSLFSTYITLENMSISSALNAIEEHLIIVKDFQGMAYLAEWDYNGIGDMILGHAYQIKVSEPVTLLFEGSYAQPEEVLLNLPQGWNMMGYLRTQQADCVAVFEEISDQIIIVKNSLGNAYLPDWDFNGIGDLIPGEGYQIKMATEQQFYFLSNQENYE